MVKIVGVRFKSVGKIYYFDPADFDINVGDYVVVETSRGVEMGRVALGIREVSEDSVVMPLRAVMRMATEEDMKKDEQNRIHEKEAFAICKEKIRSHGLEMKLVEVEYAFDRSKILFYFTADERVDFRDLVKDLAAVFKTRIELRQIGVRDETKSLGGIGMCGRILCCHSYMPDFVPVSIKMAKEQNLPLNPSKISGICGRLMCCLKNEQETYEWLNSKCPAVGDFVKTKDGMIGEVGSVNVLRQRVKVVLALGKDEKEVKEYSVEDLQFKRGEKFKDVKPETLQAEYLNAEAKRIENRIREPEEESRGNKTHKYSDAKRGKDRQEKKESHKALEQEEIRGKNRESKNHEYENRESKGQSRDGGHKRHRGKRKQHGRGSDKG